MGQIYALFSNRDGLPRDVGSTEHDAEKSLSRIVTKALKDREPGDLYDWVLNEHKQESEVYVYVLEDSVPPTDLHSSCVYWSEQFPDILERPDGAHPAKQVSAVGRVAIANMKQPDD